MYSTLDDMVVIISGRDMTRFGTGFVIHKDQQATYLLTCTHVVNDVGGEEELKAHHKPATLIASDPEFDLAVLRVEEVLDTPTLLLKTFTAKDRPVALAGFYLSGQQRLSQKLTGMLDEQAMLDSATLQTRTVCWHLEIPGNYLLEPGYSGAPIVDETTGHVLGVVNQRRGKGEKGLVISIEALKKIWPDMPPELLVEPTVLRDTLQNSEPLMNLISELEAFKNIASGQDSETRLIVVHGESGMGKSHLLKLYRRVAEEHRLELLDFSMGPQITIEECLYQIVCCFGVEHFPAYDELWSAGPPEPLTRPKERQWQRALTHKLFTDLRSYHQAPRLAVFFDQFEKADLAFKSWLTQDFLPHISARNPIIVVVAGQEDVTPPSSAKSYRPFHLNGVTVDWYHDYVKQCQAPIDSTQIKLLHTVLQGGPKLFVEYVRAQLQTGGRV